jgi:pimeloyl-ACP methyl ester carboxylesterase
MRTWRLDVRGLGLVVREISPPDQESGPPVVCLHGWLDNGGAFIPVAKGHSGRWLAMDQRGFGQSDHLGPGAYYHFADLIPDLDALVMEIGTKVHLVGHSMGGTVASMYAAVRPEWVDRLVVIEGLGAIEWGEPSLVKRIRVHLEGLRRPPRPVRLKSKADAAERLLKRHQGLTRDHAKLLAETGTSETEAGLRWSFDPLHMVRGPYPFREQWYLEFLAAIQAPTLVLWGQESWYPDEVREQRAKLIPDVRIETLPGGHMLPYDVPELLGARIAAHLGL